MKHRGCDQAPLLLLGAGGASHEVATIGADAPGREGQRI